jgi:putative mycofactocin binding protein MftB
MTVNMSRKYKLTPGTQVREENFGLLFYTFEGPRLSFLPSGPLLSCEFFQGRISLSHWFENAGEYLKVSANQRRSLENALTDLCYKGVIIGF